MKLESNPCARDSHGMTVLKHEIYLFGGSNKEKYFNDLYTFNNFVNEWKLIENKGPVIPSARDPMIFMSIKNEYLLLVGGINLQS
jgi:N-acetylneuraminic acid mutarotase